MLSDKMLRRFAGEAFRYILLNQTKTGSYEYSGRIARPEAWNLRVRRRNRSRYGAAAAENNRRGGENDWRGGANDRRGGATSARVRLDWRSRRPALPSQPPHFMTPPAAQ